MSRLGRMTLLEACLAGLGCSDAVRMQSAGALADASHDAAAAPRDGATADAATDRALQGPGDAGSLGTARPDARLWDAGLDTALDAAPDAHADGALDAGQDAGRDAGPDTTVIVLPDGSITVPATGFYAELVWDTPNDPDPTDEGVAAGADVDLHLAWDGPYGPYDEDGDGTAEPWFSSSHDCFWFNPAPDWPGPGPAGDPQLDRDDTDGAGPELIRLPEPEARTYRLGVHYWDDHGYGPSRATVRIYVDGQLAAELPDVPLQTKDLWEVATLQWPSGTITPLTNGSAPRVIPNYDAF